MTAELTLYRSDWILPVSSPPIHRGELLVDDRGRIAAVAPRGALDLPHDLRTVDLGASVLLPGLVNVHAHPELAMFRGALEDLPFRDWILRLVGARRTRLRDEDNTAAARWTMVEAIAAGITTIGATEASGAAASALREAGLRGTVYQEVFAPDPRLASVALANLEMDLERLLPLASDLVRIGVSPHAPYTVSDVLYRGTALLARERGLPMALHIAESSAERALVAEGSGDFALGLQAREIETPRRGRTPIDLLATLGVLDERPLLIHCVDVDDADIAMIASADCAVAHCPIANAKLGHGVAPVLRLRDAGVRLGIGTDSVASNNRLDILEEARFAALLQRAIGAAPDLLPAEELLRLCTIDGARALGLEDRIGTLEPGKDADFCAVSVSAPHMVPSFDPITSLFHSARGTDVMMTVVAGQVLYEAGEYRTIDPEAARAGIEEAAMRLRGEV